MTRNISSVCQVCALTWCSPCQVCVVVWCILCCDVSCKGCMLISLGCGVIQRCHRLLNEVFSSCTILRTSISQITDGRKWRDSEWDHIGWGWRSGDEVDYRGNSEHARVVFFFSKNNFWWWFFSTEFWISLVYSLKYK